jgi:hypothetical protein
LGRIRRHAFWLRTLVTTVGAVGLYLQLGLGISELDFEVFVLVAFATSLVAIVSCGVRLLAADLSCEETTSETIVEGLQFSIRHLMALTLVVACLITVGKLLAPVIDGLDTLAQISVLSICYAAVAVTAIWAVLGLGNPWIRCVFVILISIRAGIAGGFVIDGANELGFWSATTVMQGVLLILSLAVMRLVGYRLVAQRGRNT